MATIIPNATTKSRSMMAAVVLGTALSMMPEMARASNDTDQRTVQTVDEITRYCQACWRNARLPADQWSDCTQQVFIRLLERLPAKSWPLVLQDVESVARQEFVRAIDTVKKRVQRSKNHGMFVDEMANRNERITNQVTEQRQYVQEIAKGVLSPRQQQIVEMSFNGWAIPEIAEQLGTTVQRISDEKYKAVQKLKSHVDEV